MAGKLNKKAHEGNVLKSRESLLGAAPLFAEELSPEDLMRHRRETNALPCKL
jgi:hypothetical protein